MSPISQATPAPNPTPAAPAHLPEKIATQWTALYAKALKQAQLDLPGSETRQRAAALKAANVLLAVPAPTSAAEIDMLEAWQFLVRETRAIKGVLTRVCVTTDGRKYFFPAQAEKKENVKAQSAGDTAQAAK